MPGIESLRTLRLRRVRRVGALYSALSGRVHAGEISSLNAVLLVEGPLSPEDMRFLKCVADAVGCPCELRYRQVPAAALQDKQPAADTTDGDALDG